MPTDPPPGVPPATISEEVRGPIESQHNKTRDAREKKYVTDRNALETTYHNDLRAIQTAKETALLAAGLNSDGGVPPDYSGVPDSGGD